MKYKLEKQTQTTLKSLKKYLKKKKKKKTHARKDINKLEELKLKKIKCDVSFKVDSKREEEAMGRKREETRM